MNRIPGERIIILYLLLLFNGQLNPLWGQAGCVLQPPLLQIDFGNDSRPMEPGLSPPDNYERVYDYCPQDGNFAIVSSTGDCFNGHWIMLSQDHTPNDTGGKMLLVNAAYRPGLFFVTALRGLLPNTTYEMAAWLLNVCRPRFECTNIRPDLRFIVENTAGIELVKVSTGGLIPTGAITWIQYSALFKTPADVGTLILKIENKANGGCGNDFAMDDITIRECLQPKPVVKDEPGPKPVIKQPIPVSKSPVKKTPVLKPLKKDILIATKIPLKDTPLIRKPVIRERPAISLPNPILTRANPVIKQIETGSSEIVIDLYDNGVVDGDTVSIYHNNELIVSRAGLSEKPISFRLTVDPVHPHHELVMVANNLGSIPPNTSLMIITTNDKRYEVFISSSEQKNAKVVFDLKSPKIPVEEFQL
ncbi:MAG: hypothetical protein ABI760_23430 [Ferruginibacter sp.]